MLLDRAQCQLDDWKTHKKGCKIQQALNEINDKMNLEPLRPPVGRCTGCNVKFDDEDYLLEDACDDCGYQTCESCCVHSSKGAFVAIYCLRIAVFTNSPKAHATVRILTSETSTAGGPQSGITRMVVALAIRATGIHQSEMNTFLRRSKILLANATTAPRPRGC